MRWKVLHRRLQLLLSLTLALKTTSRKQRKRRFVCIFIKISQYSHLKSNYSMFQRNNIKQAEVSQWCKTCRKQIPSGTTVEHYSSKKHISALSQYKMKTRIQNEVCKAGILVSGNNKQCSYALQLFISLILLQSYLNQFPIRPCWITLSSTVIL